METFPVSYPDRRTISTPERVKENRARKKGVCLAEVHMATVPPQNCVSDAQRNFLNNVEARTPSLVRFICKPRKGNCV